MRYTKVIINGITIKDDNGAPDPNQLIEWEYEKEDDVAVSEAELILPRSVENLVQLTNGQVVEIWTGWITSTDRRTFYGLVEDIQPSGPTIKLVVKNEMIKLVRKNVNHIYDSNIDVSAGVISEIAKDLIEVYGEMIADVEYSGNAAGRTIDQFKCVNTDVYERLVALKKALDWQLNYSDSERKVKFQPRGFVDSGKTLTVGQEIIKLPKWDFDTSQMINDLRVDGAFTQTDITETGRIGVTEDFEEFGITLAKTPDIVELIMDANNPPTTQREGGTKDASVGHFYYVDRENKKVKPAEGTTFPINNYAIVNYVWSAPAPIHMVNSESIEEFGRFEKQMTISDITSIADAETRASSILNRKSLPFVRGDLFIKNEEASIPELGQIVNITDNVSPKAPSGQYIVTKIIYRYPAASIEIQVGDKAWRMADWQEDTEGRIKALEDQFVRNQDLILELINVANTPVNNIRVPIPRWRAIYARDLTESTTLVWGNSTSGIWGEFRWGNIAGAGFILGNSQYGILGTSELGFGSAEEVLYFMQQYENEYTEEFIDEDFKDSENTTAAWSSTESLIFSSGDINQTSTNAYDDLQDTDWRAQTFTVGPNDVSLTEITLKLFRNGIIGNVIVGIRATLSGIPTGEDLTSVTFDGDTLTTDDSGEEKVLTLSSPIILSASTVYAIVLRAPDQAINQLSWRIDTANPYVNGSAYLSSNSGSSWSALSGMDFWFKLKLRQIAQSKPIDFNNGTVSSVKLTAIELSGSFDYQMSANGGSNWEPITPGAIHNFINGGTDLRWRIIENVGSSGEIDKINITNYH